MTRATLRRAGLVSIAVLIGFASGRSDAAPATPAAPAPAGKPVGVLMSFAGTVRYWGQLVRGPTPVVEGSFIETGKDSNCSVLIGREAVVHIGPESRLELQSVQVELLKRAQLNFPYGKGRFLVRSLDPAKASTDQRFDLRVRSRAAVLGVRGTQFVVDSPRDANESQRFVTLEGKVAVDSLAGASKTAEIPAPGEKALVMEKGQSIAVSRDEDSADSRKGALPPTKAERAEMGSSDIESLVAAIAPPPKPLLLAGQVNDSLLPREGSKPGTIGGTPTSGKSDSGENQKDPFDPPRASDFSFSASAQVFDAVSPTSIQGGTGLDPVVDAVGATGDGVIDLTVTGEKQD